MGTEDWLDGFACGTCAQLYYRWTTLLSLDSESYFSGAILSLSTWWTGITVENILSMECVLSSKGVAPARRDGST